MKIKTLTFLTVLAMVFSFGVWINTANATFGHEYNNEHEEENDTAIIEAFKIVCPSEDLLPNWGDGGPNITASTAENFIEENPECEMVDWAFEWAPNGTANPGDNTGEAGGSWTKFWDATPTEIPAGAKIWVREVWNDDYIPFTGVNTDQSVSAEFYCHTDVLHYDNYDWISPVAEDETYYCIGFNVLVEEEEEEEKPQCSDEVDNSDPEDELADQNDPGCWTDPNDSETYDPEDNDETDPEDVCPNDDGFQTNQEECTPEELPQCSDDVDNSDPEDELADELDPGCHTDGDVDNPESYDPNDDDETDEPQDACPEVDGVQTSQEECEEEETTPPQCSDGLDNDEDNLTDYPQDPGCDNPEDNNETNTTGNSGSGGRQNSSGSIPPGQVLGVQSDICNWTVDTYMRRGYRNDAEQVKTLQEFLNWYMNTGLKVDGIYGVKTEAAVKAFQVVRAENVLTPWSLSGPTGIFYKTTLVEAKNLMCPQTLLPIPTDLVNWSLNPYQVPARI